MTDELVYCATILDNSSSGKAFELACSSEKTADICAALIRNEIIHKASNVSLSWPPNLNNLKEKT